MTQKLPLNNINGPAFSVDNAEAVLFHKLENDSDALWTLSLWVATNLTLIDEIAEESYLTVAAVPPGEAVDGPNAVVITAKVFVYEDNGTPFPDGDASVGEQQKIIQIADDFPLRGPLDLYAVGAHEGLSPFAAWGYVKRGDADSKMDRRFLDEAAIGDQQSNFSGGQAILMAPGEEGKIIHESTDDYIDEVTVRLQGLYQPSLTEPEAYMAFGWSGSGVSAAAIVRYGVKPEILFDGIPVREGGELAASVLQTSDEPAIVINGSFTRG